MLPQQIFCSRISLWFFFCSWLLLHQIYCSRIRLWDFVVHECYHDYYFLLMSMFTVNVLLINAAIIFLFMHASKANSLFINVSRESFYFIAAAVNIFFLIIIASSNDIMTAARTVTQLHKSKFNYQL
jgi:hypothetical protein